MDELITDFFHYQAQTSPYSPAFPVDYARGSYVYGKDGKAYLDFVAGVSVNTLGHAHPKVNQAIKNQLDKYAHVMVYGEYIYESSLELCKTLASKLPKELDCTYLVNSGAEAIEASLKLAKRYTGREKIIAFKNAYHGNTHGAMSVSGNEMQKRAYRPLLPLIEFINYNKEEDLDKIDTQAAAVIVETIQGAAGFITPQNNFLSKLKAKCKETGALLILDEIQPGFGRTGKLFAYEWYDAQPDILVMGKGMANGLPIGALSTSREIMSSFQNNPMLGHITTFGGNPVIAAAALATLNELYEGNYMTEVAEKSKYFTDLLQHPKIKSIHGKGLMLALEMENEAMANELLHSCFVDGLILFKLLYQGSFVRITPPLTISKEEIKKGCELILHNL